MSIDALIERMESMLGPLEQAGDARRFFHATYLRTTCAVRDTLKEGLFADPEWVERWDVAFADLYLDALRAGSGGGTVPEPWAIAFAVARDQPGTHPVVQILLGMNAHINYDLPQALLTVISDQEFHDPVVTGRRHADHKHIDEVLLQQIAAEDTELLQLSGPRSLRDWLLHPAQRAATRRFLQESRTKVWDNAVELNAARTLGPVAYTERLADLEALSADRVADLVRPGPVLLRLAVKGFGVRLVARPARPARSARPVRPRPARPARAWDPRRGAATGPSRLRSFDPRLVGDLEYRVWVGYYLRDWWQVLRAGVGLVRAGFGMSWPRTLYGAWLVLRGQQLWAPIDNDPDAARRVMRRFYALVRAAYGVPQDIAEAARLEVEWWRVHRERQHAPDPGDPDPLVDAVARLYAFLYQLPDQEVRAAAAHRTQAMDLSDQWVREGRRPDSPLLPLEHAALVRAYAALLAAVHRCTVHR